MRNDEEYCYIAAPSAMAEERLGQGTGSGDRYIDSLMRKASDLVKVRNGYFGTDKHGF